MQRLIQTPTVVRSEPGAVELSLGVLPEIFYRVHRLDFDDEIADETHESFHVLNLVAGEEIVLESATGEHRLSYAETIVVPAGVGRYRARRLSGPPCKLVKAFVPA